MSQTPLVSIVTPSYNQAHFLEETIQSVLAQDYPNLEYWVMDGGSTDGSVEVIQKYASKLSGWVSEKDGGQADAINKGLQRANGEIVAWLNSDDLYRPGAIQSAVSIFQENPEVGLVYSDVDSIDADGEIFNRMRYDQWGLKDLMAFNILGQPGVFFKRSVLENSGYLDLSYQYLLDHHLWLRMALNAPIEVFTGKGLGCSADTCRREKRGGRSRVRPGSLSPGGMDARGRALRTSPGGLSQQGLGGCAPAQRFLHVERRQTGRCAQGLLARFLAVSPSRSQGLAADRVCALEPAQVG